MFCCAAIGLFLTQFAALVGIVKIDRTGGSILRIRESITNAAELAIVLGAVATLVLAGLLSFNLSEEKLALHALGPRHICSALEIAPRQAL